MIISIVINKRIEEHNSKTQWETIQIQKFELQKDNGSSFPRQTEQVKMIKIYVRTEIIIINNHNNRK